MRKVTHQMVREQLANSVLLPCVFTLRPTPTHEPPRIKWTKVWGQRGADGRQREQSVLIAKDNVVKVKIEEVERNTKCHIVLIYILKWNSVV